MAEIFNLIIGEIDKIRGFLETNYNIIIQETKRIDYAIVYCAETQNENVVFNLYYSPKKNKFTIVPKQNSSEEIINIIKSVFDKRDFLENQEKKDEERYKELRQYFNILKPYENDEFDFIEFAEKIADKVEDKNIKDAILENRYNFKILENEYVKLTNKN